MLRQWRLERALTQRALGLPASTVAEWERGTRRPRNPEQIQRLATALALPVETIYAALGRTPPPNVAPEQQNLEAVFQSTREALLRAYRTGDTTQMATYQERLREIGPTIPLRVAATFLASRVADPLALIDLGGLLFHADQWAAAAMILEAASSALPRSSPLCLRVESNLGMIYAALGESDRAQAHDNAYLALAVDSQDQWLRVIAHCQWIEHQTIWDPLRPDLAEHLRVIADWNAEAGRSDRFLRVWEATARAQMALAQERIVEAERLVQGMNAELQQYPELASEALMLGVLEARVLGARGNRARAFEHLVHLIHQHRQRPLVERLLAYQTISRLADYAGGDMAKMWQRMTIALYYGLGAEGWVSRLTQEWEVSLDEALLMVGDVAPSGH